jgi:hypothetical protein
MYYFVATNLTCIALLLLTQHVLSSNKVIHVELVATKQTCWDSSNKVIHVESVVTKQYMLSQ